MTAKNSPSRSEEWTRQDDNLQKSYALFDWGFFIRRVWPAVVGGIAWIIESRYKHDIVGLSWAIATCFVVCPIMAYVWTRNASQ